MYFLIKLFTLLYLRVLSNLIFKNINCAIKIIISPTKWNSIWINLFVCFFSLLKSSYLRNSNVVWHFDKSFFHYLDMLLKKFYCFFCCFCTLNFIHPVIYLFIFWYFAALQNCTTWLKLLLNEFTSSVILLLLLLNGKCLHLWYIYCIMKFHWGNL